MAEEKVEVATAPEEQKPVEQKPQESAEILKLKKMLSDANSEAASYKKALREKQTEQERAEADRAEAEQKLRSELEEYRKRERISTYKSKLMEAGIPADMADTMASSLPEGVSDDYFATTKAFIEQTAQNIRAEALNAQPKLSSGIPPTSQSAQDAEQAQMRKWIGL